MTLLPGEAVAGCCRPGDIALVPNGDGRWTEFIGEGGEVERYDAPFDACQKARWAAKAAAEFDSDQRT